MPNSTWIKMEQNLLNGKDALTITGLLPAESGYGHNLYQLQINDIDVFNDIHSRIQPLTNFDIRIPEMADEVVKRMYERGEGRQAYDVLGMIIDDIEVNEPGLMNYAYTYELGIDDIQTIIDRYDKGEDFIETVESVTSIQKTGGEYSTINEVLAAWGDKAEEEFAVFNEEAGQIYGRWRVNDLNGYDVSIAETENPGIYHVGIEKGGERISDLPLLNNPTADMSIMALGQFLNDVNSLDTAVFERSDITIDNRYISDKGTNFRYNEDDHKKIERSDDIETINIPINDKEENVMAEEGYWSQLAEFASADIIQTIQTLDEDTARMTTINLEGLQFERGYDTEDFANLELKFNEINYDKNLFTVDIMDKRTGEAEATFIYKRHPGESPSLTSQELSDKGSRVYDLIDQALKYEDLSKTTINQAFKSAYGEKEARLFEKELNDPNVSKEEFADLLKDHIAENETLSPAELDAKMKTMFREQQITEDIEKASCKQVYSWPDAIRSNLERKKQYDSLIDQAAEVKKEIDFKTNEIVKMGGNPKDSEEIAKLTDELTKLQKEAISTLDKTTNLESVLKTQLKGFIDKGNQRAAYNTRAAKEAAALRVHNVNEGLNEIAVKADNAWQATVKATGDATRKAGNILGVLNQEVKEIGRNVIFIDAKLNEFGGKALDKAWKGLGDWFDKQNAKKQSKADRKAAEKEFKNQLNNGQTNITVQVGGATPAQRTPFQNRILGLVEKGRNNFFSTVAAEKNWLDRSYGKAQDFFSKLKINDFFTKGGFNNSQIDKDIITKGAGRASGLDTGDRER